MQSFKEGTKLVLVDALSDSQDASILAMLLHWHFEIVVKTKKDFLMKDKKLLFRNWFEEGWKVHLISADSEVSASYSKYFK